MWKAKTNAGGWWKTCFQQIVALCSCQYIPVAIDGWMPACIATCMYVCMYLYTCVYNACTQIAR